MCDGKLFQMFMILWVETYLHISDDKFTEAQIISKYFPL